MCRARNESLLDHPVDGPPCDEGARVRRRRSENLEALEGLRGRGHLEAKACHEDEVGVGAQGEESIAVERTEGHPPFGIEAGLGEGGLRIGYVMLAEGVVRLQAIEAAIERIAGSGRKRVVQAHAMGHVTTALP